MPRRNRRDQPKERDNEGWDRIRKNNPKVADLVKKIKDAPDGDEDESDRGV